MDQNTLSVLTEVADERARQDEKWGAVQHLPGGDGTGSLGQKVAAIMARDLCQARMNNRSDSWCDVLTEEYAEAMAESDPALLRAELIQVAAVAVKWVEDIDRRSA